MLSSARIEVISINEALRSPETMSDLRRLSLHQPYCPSGLNFELNNFEQSNRPVEAWAVCAYLGGEMVGWALVSKEPSDFYFSSGYTFNGEGLLFEVFVNTLNRKMGIASALFQRAYEQFPNETFFVSPWNEAGRKLYAKHSHIPHRII